MTSSFSSSNSLNIPDKFVQAGEGQVRYLGFIKVYDAQLYTPPDVTRKNLLGAASSRCLQLNYNVSLSAENFIEAADTILAKQHSKEALDAVHGEISQLHTSYQKVEEGDTYTLCYDAERQETELRLNHKLLVTIASATFAEYYFGIWLGEKDPLSDDLRNDLIQKLK